MSVDRAVGAWTHAELFARASAVTPGGVHSPVRAFKSVGVPPIAIVEARGAAVRLARAATRRPGIVKFAGGYHGHGDAFLIRAGSGATTLGIPDSPGVTKGAASDTWVSRYNDLDDVERCFEESDGSIAAVIVEPVAGNMGCVPP